MLFEYYIILAISYAISSMFFIHRRSLKMYIEDWGLEYDISYIIITSIIFPLVVIMWLYDPYKFIKEYGKVLSNIINDIDLPKG